MRPFAPWEYASLSHIFEQWGASDFVDIGIAYIYCVVSDMQFFSFYPYLSGLFTTLRYADISLSYMQPDVDLAGACLRLSVSSGTGNVSL
jgi:hypothetical protein